MLKNIPSAPIKSINKCCALFTIILAITNEITNTINNKIHLFHFLFQHKRSFENRPFVFYKRTILKDYFAYLLASLLISNLGQAKLEAIFVELVFKHLPLA